MDTKALKSCKNIYQRIVKNGGSYENVINNLPKTNICYLKTSKVFVNLDKDKISNKQSALIIFKEYCEFIKKDR